MSRRFFEVAETTDCFDGDHGVCLVQVATGLGVARVEDHLFHARPAAPRQTRVQKRAQLEPTVDGRSLLRRSDASRHFRIARTTVITMGCEVAFLQLRHNSGVARMATSEWKPDA